MSKRQKKGQDVQEMANHELADRYLARFAAPAPAAAGPPRQTAWRRAEATGQPALAVTGARVAVEVG
jgi:hypothetical protein